MPESDLKKFIARVKHLNEHGANETSFDIPFLMRVIKEIEQNKPQPEQVLYTGGKFKDD